ncbi:MAG: hypothetical protein K6C05_08390 [Anaerovibrio sp.]|uniref:Cas10/Cmr2 second palm domain-containing protein n=1 Tax=Anaerovibrio sp. TaxID=1872532 RepID=UPI0025DF9DA1|nr:hypothetical protein [Anaerovibrio sp.]MCR5176855.1 hypothetical protein [Anaerovibrio sp.]
MERKAILFDVRSIQRYIYAANKLRTNIGASYIVENLFSETLVKVLDKNFNGSKDLKSWEKPFYAERESTEYQCQIAYIGGGNAMVLFDISVDDDELKRLVALFSQKVLIKAPGLHIGAAIGILDFSNNETYKNSRNKLFAVLKQNQNNIIPTVSLPYTGFTQVCDIDGEVASYYDDQGLFPKERHNYYSHEIVAKANAVKKSNDKLEGMFAKELNDGEYSFPTELENLGQQAKKNYIAIVHIDGNNMGVKFSSCTDLSSHRELSADIKEKTKKSFGRLLASIVAEYEDYKSNKSLNLQEADGKKLLPIRPLILGGDDVTFICPAKVAIAYSKRFIQFMAEKSEDINTEAARSIDCCGGIAILPTKYPFFRGYILAEQLCDSAKEKMRELWDENNPDSGSGWLDFVFLHGEQAPTLKQILAREYKAALGNMHFGPYCVIKNTAGKKADDDHMLDKLIECSKQFTLSKQYMQKNKVKGLRAVLQKDEGMINSFMLQLNIIDQKMPSVEYKYINSATGWGTGINKGFTPYVDAIEMMEYMEGADK